MKKSLAIFSCFIFGLWVMCWFPVTVALFAGGVEPTPWKFIAYPIFLVAPIIIPICFIAIYKREKRFTVLGLDKRHLHMTGDELYFESTSIEKEDHILSRNYFEAALLKNSPNALYKKAQEYEKVDILKAEKCYKKASKLNFDLATVKLCTLYYKTDSALFNLKKGYKYAKRLENHKIKYPEIYYTLGNIYFSGFGTKVNLDKAILYLKKAKQAGVEEDYTILEDALKQKYGDTYKQQGEITDTLFIDFEPKLEHPYSMSLTLFSACS